MSTLSPAPPPLSHDQKLLDEARKAFRNKEYARAEKILDALLQEDLRKSDALTLAYENAKRLGKYRKAYKILNKLRSLVQEVPAEWYEQEDALCRRKIRHSNADTFLFFGVCFTAFYITARYGMRYHNNIFLMTGAAFFFIGFAMRKFYLWDKK